MKRLMGVDVGGTFTDVVAVDGGLVSVAKIPTDSESTDRSVLEGAKQLGLEGSAIFNHASTHGLNAVLTRKLPKVALITTAGHRDIIDMGTAIRPLHALTDPRWQRTFSDTRAPLVPRYLRRAVSERILADGTILLPLDACDARQHLGVLKRCGVEGVAICLLTSYANPRHEQQLVELVRAVLGSIPCSISSDVSPLAKEFQRANTTVIDIIMKLVYADYILRLDDGLRNAGFEGQLNFADSACALVAAKHALKRPFRLIVGGPAAGTTASAYFGSVIGEDNLICADVGGTSCDLVSLRQGAPMPTVSSILSGI